jgi:hypothetical protein
MISIKKNICILKNIFYISGTRKGILKKNESTIHFTNFLNNHFPAVGLFFDKPANALRQKPFTYLKTIPIPLRRGEPLGNA